MTTREYGCSACDFMIRSEGEDELIQIVQDHAESAHDMSMSAGDVRDGWSTA